MKKLMKLVALSLLAFISTSTLSAQNLKKKFSMGFGFEYGVVNGDSEYKDFLKNFYGFNVRASVKAGPGFVTLGSGANFFPIKHDFEFDSPEGVLNIPVKLGYKIVLKPFFIHPEGGLSFYKGVTYNEVEDKTKFINYRGFNYAGTAGLNLGALELGVRYQSIFNVKNDTDESFKNNKLNGLSVVVNFNF